MVTDAFNKRGQHKNTGTKRAIKIEPVEDEPEMIISDLLDYGVGEEVEIPSAVEEEVVTTFPTRKPGRPSKKSLTSPTMVPPSPTKLGRRFDGDTTPRKGAESNKMNIKTVHKSPAEVAKGRKLSLFF